VVCLNEEIFSSPDFLDQSSGSVKVILGDRPSSKRKKLEPFFFSLPVDRKCKYLIDGIYRIGPSSVVVLQYFYLLDDAMDYDVRSTPSLWG